MRARKGQIVDEQSDTGGNDGHCVNEEEKED